MAKIENERVGANSYTNPVYDRSFPDPFVLKFGDAFYGYATGFSPDGNLIFPVIRSFDLVHWENVGTAMEPIQARPQFYWAPEVTYSDGRFFLYYSCGNEVTMELRVALSDRPEGGFLDSGVALTNEQFAIDAHVFIDDDGEKYLFYATDFLEHTHVGTGTVVDRMVDWFRLEGNPRPVTRARYDWHIYDPRRAEKGNVRWHTVEGPSVLKKKGKYFQMFSGGNWKNESYGVAYAVSDIVLNAEEWTQPIDGATVFPLLRSTAEIRGPGHNSVVLGPNSREMYCVYHSWVNEERRMSIDRLDIVGDRLIILTPTEKNHLSPFLPRSARKLEADLRRFENVSSDFLLETTIRFLTDCEHIVFAVYTDSGRGLGELGFTDGRAYFQAGDAGGVSALLGDVPFETYQHLRVELDRGKFRVLLNGRAWFETHLVAVNEDLRIDIEYSEGAEVVNLDLTEGFVDLFEQSGSLEDWLDSSTGALLTVNSGELKIDGSEAAIVLRGSCFGAFEYAANVRPVSDLPFGFVLISEDGEIELLIEITDRNTEGLMIGEKVRRVKLRPPTGLDGIFRQYRFVKRDGEISLDIEGHDLGSNKVSSHPSRIGIVTIGNLFVDMVRMIRIDHE